MPLMTLSMELLPAPFGPMIALISCSRTLKPMLFSALTPPKRRAIDSNSRIGPPIGTARCAGLKAVALVLPPSGRRRPRHADRKSVVWGTGVYVRGHLGGG